MISPSSAVGRVVLVGAGPGDPGLITVRGRSVLSIADVVIFDRLVPRALLREARADATLIDAGKAPGRHTLEQDRINALLVEHARAGRLVVRLKGGDPFVFGRGFEELQACRDAGVACEVVPGISSAIAAPGAAGIPVTARGLARTLVIATPQTERGVEGEALDYEALAHADTVCLLMAREPLARVARSLIDAGKPSQTPAAIIERGTTPAQRVVVATLGTIADVADERGVEAPCVVVVGETARFAREADARPAGALAGRSIVVTRPSTASGPLVSMLAEAGAEVIDCPLIRISYDLRVDLSGLDGPRDWLVFTSLHGVRGLWRAVRSQGLDARALAGSRIAAVGPKTGAALAEIGIRPDLVPETYRAAALVGAIVQATPRPGARVVFACGTLAREELGAGLRGAGMVVDEMVVYRTLGLAPTSRAAGRIARGVDAVVIYSPSGAASLAECGVDIGDAAVACIGPTTAEAARRWGFCPAVVPSEHSDAGLVAALTEFFSGQSALFGGRA